ncbi:unnamed protein product [Didymodactylos carnosus]|uniref:Uncharacterized protein n=1 Tax=Didymodactylos carnosus TaxID=1234261 RepID=A0A814WQH7_9BILA|nr:unnamed protein product [Didymodactylos carnosus]CAF3969674.1 unnamed protein product [Didymodactylos carnosus]
MLCELACADVYHIVYKHKRLILLYAGVQELHEQHQLTLNQLVTELYETKMESDQVVLLHTMINDEIDKIILALTKLFYSMTHLINVVILLGIGIHTILELETTNTYRTY